VTICCHVMAEESFEDEDVAALMNERFVNVKVDREERPDVDAVYMAAVGALTGQGGWPMSVFRTPEGDPFFAGTYWPKVSLYGRPSFPRVLLSVSEAWQDRRDEVVGSAASIAQAIDAHGHAEPAAVVDLEVADRAARRVLDEAWDRRHGGFGPPPRFPQAMTIEWLLEHHARTGDPEVLAASLQALDAMARGGIHDQLAGGFARYSTDVRWLVPHFEKMLYDNALLLAAYASAAAITADPELERVARSTAAFLLSDMRTPEGAFVSAFDADSEGVEGRYYAWGHDELVDVIGSAGLDGELWASYLGVIPEGNWEGSNVLHEPVPRGRFAQQHDMSRRTFDAEWDVVRTALLERRASRAAPAVDDKVLADWNALAVRGLVRAGVLLDETSWIEAAAGTAGFLHDHLLLDGELHHAWRQGRLSARGFLEDHALLALADLELFQATGEPAWFERGLALAERADELFRDGAEAGWFQTAHDAEALFTRPKQTWDDVTPAGGSVMVEVCLALAGFTGEPRWRLRAEEGLRAAVSTADQAPTGHGWLLRQIEAVVAGPREVAVVGPAGRDRHALLRIAAGTVRPGVRTVASSPDHADRVPLLEGRGPVDGRAAAYVCRELACERPVADPGELERLLDATV